MDELIQQVLKFRTINSTEMYQILIELSSEIAVETKDVVFIPCI